MTKNTPIIQYNKYSRLGLSDRRYLLEKQNNKCFYCSVSLKSTLLGHADDFNTDPDWACVDHKIPRSKNGKTDLKNCVIACRSCNCKKGATLYSGGK